MGAPQRLRDRIVAVGGNFVGDRGGRAVALAAAAVEPAQAVDGARQRAACSSGTAADGDNDRKNDKSTMARAIGGSTIHNPAQENARNRPSAVASVASAGHSRSHNRLPRARWSARASKARVGFAGCSGCSSKPSKSRSVAGLRRICCVDQTTTQAIPGPCVPC